MSESSGKRVRSVREFAAVMGVSLSVAYEAVRTGQVRTIRIGRRWLIPDAVIEEMLNAQQTPSQPAG